ncbi:hypothetical protein T01_7922 [Trichinella spiralis]|uniref:Uncharacterized protein n=1 Tax=Trichinella spiralis TaxID=6334 RepID=A0A0V1AHF4_TRISP|nr:hypothetical protein T01_7922 [Trichinella spiralis]
MHNYYGHVADCTARPAQQFRSFTGDEFVLNDLFGPSDGIYERHKFAK